MNTDIFYNKNKEAIRNTVSEAAILEQTAEEATELAQALLKYARILRNENPTPVEAHEAFRNIVEEYSDVSLCMDILCIYPKNDLKWEKEERWVTRLKEKYSK